jgi:hypothetical protein
MHRIDGPGHVGNTFVEGDPLIPQEATIVTAAWTNAVQEEIANVVEDNGLVLDKADNTQLLQSIGGGRFFKNQLMNGLLEVCQRFAITHDETRIFTANGGFHLDRWYVEPGQFGTVHGQHMDLDLFSHTGQDQAGLPKVDGKLAKYFIWDQTSPASSSTVKPVMRQRIEDVRILAGETVTFSFYARLNMPVTVGLDQFQLELTQNFGTGGIGPSSPVSYTSPTFEITQSFGTWERYQFTTTLGAIGLKIFGTNDDSYLEAALILGDGGEAFTLYLAGIQLEVGSAATSLESIPFEVELARCQRYYEHSYSYGIEAGTVTDDGAGICQESGTVPYALAARYRAEKAFVPSVTWYSPGTGAANKVEWGGADLTLTGPTLISTAWTGLPGTTTHSSSTEVLGGHWTAEAER